MDICVHFVVVHSSEKANAPTLPPRFEGFPLKLFEHLCGGRLADTRDVESHASRSSLHSFYL